MSNSKEQEATLTLKDRINYPYILAVAILTCNKAVLGQEFSHEQIVEANKNLRRLIPKKLEDDEFKKDLEDAKIVEKKDLRPLVVANIRMTEDICKQLSLPIAKEHETYDYEKLGSACINLLSRRGMLSKEFYLEKMVPEPDDFEPDSN